MSKPLALIIEDDKRQSNVFAQALSMADFETEIIRDGQVAQTRLNEVVPAVVVLDMHLPHVSGKTLLEQIRSDDRLTQVRVMLATADPSLADTVHDEADLVLLKPISFSQLRDLAERLNPDRSG